MQGPLGPLSSRTGMLSEVTPGGPDLMAHLCHKPVSEGRQWFQTPGPATAQCQRGLCVPTMSTELMWDDVSLPKESECSEWLQPLPFPVSYGPSGGHWDLGCCVHTGAVCSLVRPPCPGLIARSLYAPPIYCRIKVGPAGVLGQCMSHCFRNTGPNRSQPCLEDDLLCILVFASYKRPVGLPALSSTLPLYFLSSPAQSYHDRDFPKPQT